MTEREVSSERVSDVNRLAADLTGVRLTPFHTHKSLRELIAYAREMETELLALRSSVKTVENDPHRFVVVSADYSRPFLAGAYPKLENALKAQCGSPEKWHIFERYAIEAPAGEGEAVAMMVGAWDTEDCISWLEGCERLSAGDYLYTRPSPATPSEVTELIAWLRSRAKPDSGLSYGDNSRGIAEATVTGYDAAFVAENFHGAGAARLADILTAALKGGRP